MVVTRFSTTVPILMKQKSTNPFQFGEFVVVPPFGSEKLIVLAQKTPHPRVDTIQQGGYRFLNTKDAKEAMDAVFGPPPGRGLQVERATKSISVSTQESQ